MKVLTVNLPISWIVKIDEYVQQGLVPSRSEFMRIVSILFLSETITILDEMKLAEEQEVLEELEKEMKKERQTQTIVA